MIQIIRYLFFIALCVLVPVKVKAVLFTELGYNPAGTDTGHEWVELYNDATEPIDLTSIQLYTTDPSEAAPLQISAEAGGQGTLIISPASVAIVAANAKFFLTDHPNFQGTVVDSSMSLRNGLATGETSIAVGLLDQLGKVVVSTSYIPPTSKDGFSLEWRENQWKLSELLGGSPGIFMSAQQPSPIPTQVEINPSIRLSEILSNPVGNDTGNEWVEIENYGDQSVDVSGWKIADKDQTHSYTIGIGTSIGAHNYLKVVLNSSMLNNSDETVSLLSADGNSIDTTILVGVAKEGWSYAFVAGSWVWTDQLTPGAQNKGGLTQSVPVPVISSKTTNTPTPKSSTSATKSPSPKASPKATKSPSPTSSKMLKLSTTVSPRATVSSVAKKNIPSLQPLVKGATTEHSTRLPLVILVSGLCTIALAIIIIYRFKLLTLIAKFRERWRKDLIV